MKTDSAAKDRPWIRPLPERLINKIAAGEVIERPAAVLKELVENSLDAGATRIEIKIDKSGLKLIAVIDNGCGIDPEQVEIAFARHATSKIRSLDDLESLGSYGFRGEALPSIASVSRTRMITRASDSEAGQEIIIEGGVVQSLKPVASPVGTTVEVSDLFFNTPARRKFLKSEITEARQLTRTATAMALGAAGVRFSYSLNGKTIYDVSGEDSPKARVGQLVLGQRQARLAEIESRTAGLEIAGYLAYPDQCRQNRYGLYLFINERYIQSVTLAHAVLAGYGEILPRGHYPVGAIFLKLDPERVDVNVHPTKAEVRLTDERQMHDLLYEAVKRSLRSAPTSNAPAPMALSSESEGHRTFETYPENRPPVQQPAASSIKDSLQTIARLYGPPTEADSRADIKALADGMPHLGEVSLQPDQVSRVPLEGLFYLGQFGDLYLLFRTGEELLVMDQHAAHERVLYERQLQIFRTGGAVSQQLLFPLNIDLAPDMQTVFDEAGEILRASGFEAAPFGSGTVLLSSVPATLTRRSPEKTFRQILADIEEYRREGAEMKKAVAQSIACRGAVMAGDKLSEAEALGLFRDLLKTETSSVCPHGRPIIYKITKHELDRKFGRK